jgi:hypothetical protein
LLCQVAKFAPADLSAENAFGQEVRGQAFGCEPFASFDRQAIGDRVAGQRQGSSIAERQELLPGARNGWVTPNEATKPGKPADSGK